MLKLYKKGLEAKHCRLSEDEREVVIEKERDHIKTSVLTQSLS